MLFQEFAKTGRIDNAESILVEMQNQLLARPDMAAEVQDIIKNADKHTLIPLPGALMAGGEESTFHRAANYNVNILIGSVFVLLGLLPLFMPGSRSFRIGFIIVGLSFIIKGTAR